MSKERTLESFSKQDLVTYIKQRWPFAHDRIAEMERIEWQRKEKEIEDRMIELETKMKTLSLPRDWNEYKILSGKWDAARRAWDRLYNAYTGNLA